MAGSNEIIKEISVTSTTIPQCSNACSFGGCCDCCCCNGGQALCIAKSECDSESTIPALVDIPANSCITKIYASMPNASTNAKYFLIEILDGDSTKIFCHAVPNTGNEDPVFDTTLVQPLCVKGTSGTGNAIITVTAFNQTNTALAELLTLTVVFCPDCC